MLNGLNLSRRVRAGLLTTALVVVALVASPGLAQAADHDRLPFDKHKDLEFLGSISLPVASGSLSNRDWLEGGAIRTSRSCPRDAVVSRSKLVFADGTDTTMIFAVNRYDITQPGSGLDGQPINLSIDPDNPYETLLPGGFQDQDVDPPLAIIPAQDFWMVLTCEDRNLDAEVGVISPYFAVKLTSDGTNWRVAGSGPVQSAPTVTKLGWTSSQLDQKVTFSATVSADSGVVSDGVVEFVSAVGGTLLGSGTVVNGKVEALSSAAIDSVDGVSVKAVYKGAAGFAASESAAQQVFGVAVPNPGTVPGDVVVEVPMRDTPAGSIKFTAAAAADLGKATLTPKGITATGSIAGAVVADGRRDKTATWTVNGVVSGKFTTDAPAVGSKAREIPASALSWEPATKKGTTLPAGATIGAKGSLDSPRTLLTWAQGGTGESELKSEVGAGLILDAVGDFVPGSYTAKLMLTLV